MIDRDGNKVERGTLLRNPNLGSDAPVIQCIGYDYRNGNILLRQDRAGEVASSLNQDELWDSAWRTCGFKQLPDVAVDL